MPLSLTLSPSQIEYVAKPGATITQVYQIKNDSPQALVLTTQVLPWLPQGINGSVVYPPGFSHSNLEFSLANADLQLGQSFPLAAGESRQLLLKIKLSPEISLSDYYSTFFISQDPLVNTPDNPQVTVKIGSHILLSVSNTANTPSSLSFSHTAILPRFKDVFLTPLRFQGQVNNSSPYFTSFAGQITLTKNNKTVHQLNISSQNVLANSSRSLLCQDNPTCTLQPPFWPGAYTATYSLASSSASATEVFYVFPFSPILFLALFAAVVWFIFRRR